LQSAHGFRFCEGSNFAISHWLGWSPLTQCWRYRAACDSTWHYSYLCAIKGYKRLRITKLERTFGRVRRRLIYSCEMRMSRADSSEDADDRSRWHTSWRHDTNTAVSSLHRHYCRVQCICGQLMFLHVSLPSLTLTQLAGSHGKRSARKNPAIWKSPKGYSVLETCATS